MAKAYHFIRNWAHLYECMDYGEDGWRAKRAKPPRYNFPRPRQAYTHKAEYMPVDRLSYSDPSEAVACLLHEPT